jgi:ATP-dependent DNA helicase RecG
MLMTTHHLPISICDILHGKTVEWERLEFKAGWNPEAVLHTLCAFANDFHNLGGGYIVVGVEEEDGRPVLPPLGLAADAIDAIQKELLNLGHSAIQPPYHPRTVPYEVDGKTILIIWVPGGETRPYKARVSLSEKRGTEWAYYIRKQSSTVRAKGADEQELIGLTATLPFDDRFNQQATVGDLNPRLMREFLEEVGSDLAGEVDVLPLESVGRQMNIVSGPSEMAFPKNVGLLFFNEQPERFFPATQIDVVWFPEGAGGDRFEEKIFQGPLARMTREALAFIQRNYLKETVVKHPDRAEAERFWNFPFAAIEEALVNAIYHRSYEIREPVEVRITREDLVILSFPGPDRSVRMEDLRRGKAVSRRYRNRRIGEFLKELELTEGRSTGIPKILRVMRENGSPEPEFETDEDRTHYLVRLPVHARSDWGEEDSTPQITHQVTPQVKEPSRDQVKGPSKDQVEALGATGQVTGQAEAPSNPPSNPPSRHQVKAPSRDQVKLLRMCLVNSNIKELMDLSKRTDRTKFRHQVLNPLIEQGFIEMTQPSSPNSPTQKYRLTEKGRALLQTLS